MCLDGNSAPASVRYINAQLAAQWQNAADCVAYFGTKASLDLSSTSYKKSRYTRSLAQFHYAGKHHVRGPVRKEHLHFSGSFGEPKLQFICNHEAVFHLNLREGHLNTRISKVHSANARPNTHDNVDFKNVDVAIRVKFHRRRLVSEDPLIGNSNNIIQLMVLDYSSARIVSHNSGIARDVLFFYVHKYLDLLRDAGHHVFFDLPDFDDDAYSPLIDYSLSTTAAQLDAYCVDIDLHGGVHLSSVNDFLKKSWLKAVAASLGLTGPTPADRLSTCLTEIKSIWLPNVQTHFHLKFNPPTVRAICAHEAVFYFNVQEILFYETADFTLGEIETYSDWKIAVIVNTIEIKNEEGEVIGIDFDFTSARFCRHLSVIIETTEVAVAYFEKLVQFITVEYVELLIEYKLYQVHVFDVPEFKSIPSLSETSTEYESGPETSGPVVGGGVGIGAVLVERILYGFDQIISVSEESINAMLITLWKHARDTKTLKDDLLVEWSYEDIFSSTFDAMKVELLSDSQAIVRVNIVDGSMTLKGYNHSVAFSSWTVAFLVDIKMVEHCEEEMSGSWLTRFKESILGRKRESEHHHIKHLVLDFANARFLLDQSTLSGLWGSGTSSAVSKFESIVYYTKLYLNQVAHNGYNVLYSVPLSTATVSSFAITSVSFQIVSKTVVTVHNRHKVRTAPVILVTGMCGHRTLPRVTLSWHEGWIVRKAYGTVLLSRADFLDGRLLPALAHVNAKTTVLPRFPQSVDEDEFSVYLSTLENHPYRKNKRTDWQFAREQVAGWRKYDYEHRDEWTYEHENSQHHVGAYSVSCHTRNDLFIPTHYRSNSMQIVLRGESVLRIKGKKEHQHWSQRASAKWSAHIQVYSEWNGLRVSVNGPPKMVFDRPESTGVWSLNAHDLLSAHLPELVDIDNVVSELKRTLEGVWEYSFPGTLAYNLANPVFTVNGDLILQLRPHDPTAKPPTIQPAQKKTAKAKDGSRAATTVAAPRVPKTNPTRSPATPVSTTTKTTSFYSKMKNLVTGDAHKDPKDNDRLRATPSPTGTATAVNTPIHELPEPQSIAAPKIVLHSTNVDGTCTTTEEDSLLESRSDID